MKRTAPPAAYRLVLEYDGSRYHGWQRQGEEQSARGIRTVAGTLERTLRDAGLSVLTLGGAGRTDAGVHAAGQVAHLHLAGADAPSARELRRILDTGLPSDVAARSVTGCSPGFHARRDALSRSYLYQVCLRRSAFAKPYVWWVKGRLDREALAACWRLFEGIHTMAAFADLEPGEDPHCKIGPCECVRDGSLLLLRATADHFLRRQVRRMIGAAVLCGLGRERESVVARDLEAPTPEAALRWAERAAPASGLFLERVRYPGEPETGPPAALIPVP